MRKSIISRTTECDPASDDAVPKQPRAGDVCVGCVHEPDIYAGSHYYWVGVGGLIIKRPVEAETQWVLLCDACFVRFGQDFRGALIRHELPIGCVMQWPEGVTIEFRRH